uniref:Uncharacterized protein n=1 Tax=Caenorhabditis japonica TaxID=281687 RepID=A0A8R1IRL3_CAEJA
MVIGSISEEIHENHYNEIWAALQGSPEAITKIISRNSDPASGSIAGVASEDMCCLLGIGQLLEPTSHTAIGSFMLFQDTHFTKGKCVPSGPQSYELILGNDLLQRLPKFYLDHTKGVFEIGEDKLPLGQQRNASIFPSRHAVHVMKDTVIPARSESFVRCIVPGVAQTADLVLLSQTNTLSSQDLVVAPAVFSANFVNLLVTNPTNEPKILYTNTKAASATEVITENGPDQLMQYS